MIDDCHCMEDSNRDPSITTGRLIVAAAVILLYLFYIHDKLYWILSNTVHNHAYFKLKPLPRLPPPVQGPSVGVVGAPVPRARPAAGDRAVLRFQ